MRRRLLRILSWILFALLVAGTLWWVTHREEVAAQRRAVIIAAGLQDIPVLTRTVTVLTREPEPGLTDAAGPLDARLLRPGGDDDAEHPTIVLLVPRGASVEELAGVLDAQGALARAGFNAWSVRLPPTVRIADAAEPVEQLVEAIEVIADHPTTDRDQVAIAGVGAGASLGLVAAADPRISQRVSAMLLVQPYADVQGVLRLAVTGTARTVAGTDVPHRAGLRIRRSAAHSVVDALEEQGVSSRVTGLLDVAIDRAEDPLRPLALYPSRLLPVELAPVHDMLVARDAAAFDQAWERLPDPVRELAEARSPSAVVEEVEAHLTFVVPVDDSLLPAQDAERLAADAPRAQLVRTDLLDPEGGGEPTTDELLELLDDATTFLRAATE